MPSEFISLNEAALKVKKSVQTLRRLIKKGDLVAQRLRTAQGFNYMVETDQLFRLFSNSPIQNERLAQHLEQNHSAPIHEKFLINQTAQRPHKENDFYYLDIQDGESDVKYQKEIVELKRALNHCQREKMGLIEILEKLQELWWKN